MTSPLATTHSVPYRTRPHHHARRRDVGHHGGAGPVQPHCDARPFRSRLPPFRRPWKRLSKPSIPKSATPCGRRPRLTGALIGTLFLYILLANWSSLIPGVEPPTAHLETDAAMAIVVFFAAIYYGIRARGMAGYLKTFAQPSFVMIPLNIAEAFTRTFSMTVRLFGNVMSGVFIIGVVLSLAGLFVPIPLMALDILTGRFRPTFLPCSPWSLSPTRWATTSLHRQKEGIRHELD